MVSWVVLLDEVLEHSKHSQLQLVFIKDAQDLLNVQPVINARARYARDLSDRLSCWLVILLARSP